MMYIQLTKEISTQLLSKAFIDNKSVNYVIKNDHYKQQRIEALMDYAFDICSTQKIFHNDNCSAIALCDFPRRKKDLFLNIYKQLEVLFKAFGILYIFKLLKREAYIKQFHPKTDFIYLWFVGVAQTSQGQGKGSQLMQEIITYSKQNQLPIYLETSNEKNLIFYQRLGFNIFHTWNDKTRGFPIWFMRYFP